MQGENSIRQLERIFGSRIWQSLTSKTPHWDVSRDGCLHPGEDRRMLATALRSGQPSHPQHPSGEEKGHSSQSESGTLTGSAVGTLVEGFSTETRATGRVPS